MGLKFGSVCSGIEAASQAWGPLGWQAAFFAEIEKFPSAVLAHHYPHVPNYGDMTKFEEWPDHGPSGSCPIDILCGGTPCQSFSIAGLRGGLDDCRGNLSLTFGAIARRYRPTRVVWENVPGVLSSNGGRDFASILGLLAGVAIEPPEGGWKNAGYVTGYENAYGLAWRVLDAQFVRVDGFERAVPQRRRRVVLVGHLGSWRRAAAVLFERESLSGHPAPGRKARQDVAPTISARPTGGGGLGTDFDLDGGLICANSGDIANTICANSQHSLDAETETLIAFSAKDHGADGMENLSPTLRAGGHSGSHANAGVMPAVCLPESLARRDAPRALSAIAIQERAVSENPDSGPDGAGVRDDGAAYTLEARTTAQAVAFSIMPMNSGKDYKARETDVAQPIMAGGPVGGNQGGDYIIDQKADRPSGTIAGSAGAPAPSRDTQTWAVRRLTPTECERLQGFPDGHTLIPWRGKPAENCPDGPRYKALGNSWAVNKFRWLGRRIEMVDRLISEGRI